ncbi:MAG: ABC transporter permease [Actinobacteria bacterium]|nr:ABC transporter permease [Actinomycetota bacterium]
MTTFALRRLGQNRPILLAYGGALALFAVTSAFSPGFASANHIRILLIQASFVALVALGQSFVILGGGIDLSVPWTLNGSAILMTLFADGQNRPLVWVIPLLVALGGLIGLVNGLGITALGVSPIIMTLGMNVILSGGLLVYTNGSPTAAAPAFVETLATGRVGPVPYNTLIWLALASLATVVLTWTAFGRHLYALGTNRMVAQFSGIAVSRVTVVTYVISGMTAAFAGILLTGYVGQAYLGMGDPYLFASVAAVAIGGASILGGSGHYLGTIAGALILTVLAGLLPILNLNTASLQVIYGVVILATVALATLPGRLAVTR